MAISCAYLSFLLQGRGSAITCCEVDWDFSFFLGPGKTFSALAHGVCLTDHFAWPNLGRRVALGYLDFREREKEAGTLLNMFENFLCSYVLMEECFFSKV